MAVKLRLTSHHIADLEVIVRIGAESIRAILKHLKDADSLPLRPNELVNEISQVLKSTEEEADIIARNAVLYCGLMSKMDLDAAELLDAISKDFNLRSEWSDAEVANLEKIWPVFQELLLLKAVRLVTATLDLSYEYANLHRSARIITDIRPIYDEPAEQIEGAVVSHTLRLRYDSSEGEHELSIALDTSDIRDLSKQCDRAIVKAQTAQTLMIEKAQIPTSISGDDGNAT